MKRILIVLFLFLSYSSFADAGYAYRFHLNLQSENKESISGFFYFYTYKKFNCGYNKSFKEFYEGKDEIILYSNIITLNVGTLILDVTHKDYKTKIKLSDFWRVDINEFVDFGNTDRLLELSTDELNLIKGNKPKSTSIYNKKYAENCSLILLTWNDNTELLEDKNEISEKIKSFEENITKYNDELNNYLRDKEKSLLNKDILLISHCDAL
ncbi:hypothetical protein [Winogradskyella forsetii]|uniref:hypothetical protein n=1 Tax=Winogradskyella forsetii TaxID=2686077 RepID=UPI0015B95B25|nr:hypothetical protein [Winogradskyella forsetii]